MTQQALQDEHETQTRNEIGVAMKWTGRRTRQEQTMTPSSPTTPERRRESKAQLESDLSTLYGAVAQANATGEDRYRASRAIDRIAIALKTQGLIGPAQSHVGSDL
jgi:hypothetical protein